MDMFCRIDRSAKAIALAKDLSRTEIAAGRLSFRQVAAEEFQLKPDEASYDIVALRVGTLDGRHPAEQRAKRCIAAALRGRGRLFIDGGDPLREIVLGDW